MNDNHTFHIPVMGIGYTIDTPLKVAPYGIDSVISLVDDILLERLRKMYCHQNNLTYTEITDKEEDYRAKRITAYLNLMLQLTTQRWEQIKESVWGDQKEIKRYLSFLEHGQDLITTLESMNLNDKAAVQEWVDKHISMGSIDVNIMTKVDKINYRDDVALPSEYNDAHAALRGFALSDLDGAVILSAGINPRLYSYIEMFDDFYPDQSGYIKKRIILKVSDYRSAFIQGRFLAKKGIWVSEYRIESGLNCGGHAFATDGFLLGPVMAEFKENRKLLTESLYEILVKSLSAKNRILPTSPLTVEITAQGGVGTVEEHQFMLETFGLNSVGWGTPFLLVPEVTCVDEKTLHQLVQAKEDDLYLSDISPLGIPFNSLRGNTKDIEKQRLIDKGRPGSACPKKFVSLNNEFDGKAICTASRQYQHLKLSELDKKELSPEAYQSQYERIVAKACICVGLGSSALLSHQLDTKIEGAGVSICPGPNLAYFSRVLTLEEMIDHIYGRTNVISRTDRPQMFIKELTLYLDYLENKISSLQEPVSNKDQKYVETFAGNLDCGISFYRSLISDTHIDMESRFKGFVSALDEQENRLQCLQMKIEEQGALACI